MEGKEMQLVYETLLSAPGMNDLVKLDFKISRKLILLIVEIIERGLSVKGAGLPESADAELKEEMQVYMTSCIDRAELSTLYQKLKQFKN